MNDKSANLALLILRVVAGLVLFYYGSQKLLGWFGGQGFNGTLATFQSKLNIPPVLAALATFAEFFGGLGLILGLFTRIAAFGAACTMAVATYIGLEQTKTLVAGAGENPVRNFAYPLLVLAIALALLLMGGGAYSLERRLVRAKRG